MKQSISLVIVATLLTFGILVPTNRSLAEEAVGDAASYPANQPKKPEFIHVLGSVLLTAIHVPIKLVTCVGTQATSAVAYSATYGVEGHYDGGTNGRDIGETARRSCTGSWIVRPEQVVRDYGE